MSIRGRTSRRLKPIFLPRVIWAAELLKPPFNSHAAVLPAFLILFR